MLQIPGRPSHPCWSANGTIKDRNILALRSYKSANIADLIGVCSPLACRTLKQKKPFQRGKAFVTLGGWSQI